MEIFAKVYKFDERNTDENLGSQKNWKTNEHMKVSPQKSANMGKQIVSTNFCSALVVGLQMDG